MGGAGGRKGLRYELDSMLPLERGCGIIGELRLAKINKYINDDNRK